MENKRYEGKSLNEAIIEASIDLGIQSADLNYKLIQEGSKGFLGFGAKKFIIEIVEEKTSVKTEKPKEKKQTKAPEAKEKTREFAKQPKKSEEAKPVKPAAVDNTDKKENKSEQHPAEKPVKNFDRENRNNRRQGKENRNDRDKAAGRERTEKKSFEERAKGGYAKEEKKDAPRKYEKTGTVTGDPVKTAEEFLTGLFKSMEMNISYKGEFKSENNELTVDLSGDDMGVLIGKRGQTLDALQYLTSQVVNKHQTAYIRVKIDTENYRERRRETMETLAQNIAQKVKRTHKPVALEPMNPYERRIIHSILQNEKDIITRSEGVEPYRHVIVCPAKKNRRSFDKTSEKQIEKLTETQNNPEVINKDTDKAEAELNNPVNISETVTEVSETVVETKTEITVNETEA